MWTSTFGTVYCSENLNDCHVIVTGQLHVPLDVCGAVVKRELDWWHVEDSLIEPCCWIKYSKVWKLFNSGHGILYALRRILCYSLLIYIWPTNLHKCAIFRIQCPAI